MSDERIAELRRVIESDGLSFKQQEAFDSLLDELEQLLIYSKWQY